MSLITFQRVDEGRREKARETTKRLRAAREHTMGLEVSTKRLRLSVAAVSRFTASRVHDQFNQFSYPALCAAIARTVVGVPRFTRYTCFKHDLNSDSGGSITAIARSRVAVWQSTAAEELTGVHPRACGERLYR